VRDFPLPNPVSRSLPANTKTNNTPTSSSSTSTDTAYTFYIIHFLHSHSHFYLIFYFVYYNHNNRLHLINLFVLSSTSITTVALPTTSILAASLYSCCFNDFRSTNKISSLKCLVQYVSYITILHIQPPESNFEPSPRFFSNKGEVASIFTVVRLVRLAVLITIVTICICRRRVEKFDRDVAEAAMQAAATSRSANFDDYGYGSNGNPYTGYSTGSHGTYGQPAMSHGGHSESYVMSDVGMGADVGWNAAAGAGAGAGAGYEYAAAGATGIGAVGGAVAMQRA
jgi:hypothetical protein